MQLSKLIEPQRSVLCVYVCFKYYKWLNRAMQIFRRNFLLFHNIKFTLMNQTGKLVYI